MILGITCQACGTHGRAATRADARGFGLVFVGNWRARNAPYAIDQYGMKLPCPSMVILCSDICEERYRREVGLIESRVS